MKLICVGDINQDIITPTISYFPLKDEQLIVKDFKWFLGGGAAITAAAASSMGLDTTLVGCVGNDLIGKMMLSKIASYGVKSKIKISATPTEVTFAVTFENSSRSFITTTGANKDLMLKDLPSLKGFNHLHLSNYYHMHSLQKDYERLINKARDYGLTISFDPSFIAGANPSKVKNLLPLIDVLFINEVELKKYGGMQYCAKKVPILAIHLGAKGSMVLHKGRRYKKLAPRTKILNSTGAGDVYNAGFIKSYIEGEDLDKCLSNGVKAATHYVKQKEQIFPSVKKKRK